MKCDECGGAVRVDRNAVRRYVIGGLHHVELHGIEVTHCKSCGKEEIGVPRVVQLHRVLADLLVHQQRMLANTEIRFLRKHLGLSGVEFAQRMGVTRETVSRWETGAQEMGSAADRLLRALVVTHEPTESYAVDDLLKELPGTLPLVRRPSSVAMQNIPRKGWRPEPTAA